MVRYVFDRAFAFCARCVGPPPRKFGADQHLSSLRQAHGVCDGAPGRADAARGACQGWSVEPGAAVCPTKLLARRLRGPAATRRGAQGCLVRARHYRGGQRQSNDKAEDSEVRGEALQGHRVGQGAARYFTPCSSVGGRPPRAARGLRLAVSSAERRCGTGTVSGFRVGSKECHTLLVHASWWLARPHTPVVPAGSPLLAAPLPGSDRVPSACALSLLSTRI